VSQQQETAVASSDGMLFYGETFRTSGIMTAKKASSQLMNISWASEFWQDKCEGPQSTLFR